MTGRSIWNVRRAIILWVINSSNHNHQTIYDVSLTCVRTEKHISVELHLVKSYYDYGLVVFLSVKRLLIVI